MKIKDLKLGAKQKIGFGIILLLMASVNIFSIRKMVSVKGELDEVSMNRLPRAIAVSDINLYTSRLRSVQLQSALTDDGEIRNRQQRMQMALIDSINSSLDTYEELKKDSEQRQLYSDQELDLYTEFDWKWEEYQDLSLTFLDLVNENNTKDAIALLRRDARDVYDTLSNKLEALVSVNKNDALQAAERADIMLAATRKVTFILLVATIVLSGALGTVFVRYITVPIRQLEKAARDIAEGDLTVHIDVPSKDEIGNLASSFNQMTVSLRQATEQLQHQAEDLRKKNQELESALHELQTTQDHLMMKEKMAALGDLVAGITHEINNPIGTVNSSTDVSDRCVKRIEVLLHESASLVDLKDNAEFLEILNILKDNIQVIFSAGDRISAIVRSLKNFATLDESDYQRADIHDGIESSLTLMEGDLRGRVEVVKEYSDIPKIECYPGLLNQVFMNLLKNASQAIEESGTIIIKTHKDNNHIHVTVSDSGCGIPDHKLKKLFGFGFSAVGKRVKMGSGLATAYNIVQKHNGDIIIDSEVGQGTTVRVRLPIQP